MIESYEEVLSAEKQAFPLVKDAAMQERAREICSLANPPGARTVRDFHRPGCGYGQSALIAVDYGHKRGEQRSLFNLLAGLRYITDAKEGDIAMSDGEVCLSVGDLAVILNDDGFTLLRVSRPHPVTRCRPRCLVFGHALMETEEHVYVYDNVSQDESKACFGDLLLHDGAPVKVDRKLVDLTLEQGAIAVTLSEEMLSLIEDAVYDTKQQGDASPNTGSDSESESDNTVQLRQRSSESARLSTIGQLPRNQRSRRSTKRALWWHAVS